MYIYIYLMYPLCPLAGGEYRGVGIATSPTECLDMVTSHLIEDFNGNRIVIDCTENPTVRRP